MRSNNHNHRCLVLTTLQDFFPHLGDVFDCSHACFNLKPHSAMSSWHYKHPQYSLKLNFNVFIDISYDISKHMGQKLLPCVPNVSNNPHIKTNSAFCDDFTSSCWLIWLCLFKLLCFFFLIQHFLNVKQWPMCNSLHMQISDIPGAFCAFFLWAAHGRSFFSSIFTVELESEIWISVTKSTEIPYMQLALLLLERNRSVIVHTIYFRRACNKPCSRHICDNWGQRIFLLTLISSTTPSRKLA